VPLFWYLRRTDTFARLYRFSLEYQIGYLREKNH
jgi:hypothetical protein